MAPRYPDRTWYGRSRKDQQIRRVIRKHQRVCLAGNIVTVRTLRHYREPCRSAIRLEWLNPVGERNMKSGSTIG